jgi:hypothetical protein
MAECIHGFEGELCDSCFPKAVPEKPKVTRAAATPRRTAGASTSRKSLNTADVRIYHVTHVKNLPAIIEAGELRADTRPALDVSSELTRELRATASVAPGSSVAEYVPFYLAPDSGPWEELRRGAAEPRWSADARAASSTDFVFLVSTVKSLGDSAVIADGDAAGSVTRFATTPEDAQHMLVRLHDDADRKLGAEALARESFPVDAVQLIGVANDRVRDTVKDLLADSGFTPKVAVYPPWFQLAE